MNEKVATLLVRLAEICVRQHCQSLEVEKYSNGNTACTLQICNPGANHYATVPADFFTVLQNTFPGIEFWISPKDATTILVEIDFCADSDWMRRSNKELQEKINEEIKKFCGESK